MPAVHGDHISTAVMLSSESHINPRATLARHSDKVLPDVRSTSHKPEKPEQLPRNLQFQATHCRRTAKHSQISGSNHMDPKEPQCQGLETNLHIHARSLSGHRLRMYATAGRHHTFATTTYTPNDGFAMWSCCSCWGDRQATQSPNTAPFAPSPYANRGLRGGPWARAILRNAACSQHSPISQDQAWHPPSLKAEPQARKGGEECLHHVGSAPHASWGSEVRNTECWPQVQVGPRGRTP